MADLELHTIKIQKMKIKSTNDNTHTAPAITYSECYAQPFIRLINGDCLEVMKDIPANSIDAIITDPPYGVSYQSNMRKNKFGLMANDDITDAAWLAFGARTLKEGGMIYCFSRWDVLGQWKNLIQFFGLEVRSCIVWDKGRGGMGDLVGSYAPSYEMIIVAARGRNSLKNGRGRDVIQVAPHRSNMLHPAQKPVELLEQLIKDSTNEGDTVLDCFMGSGSTMEACVNTGRKGIGIELSKDYYHISKKRIESHTVQAQLF